MFYVVSLTSSRRTSYRRLFCSMKMSNRANLVTDRSTLFWPLHLDNCLYPWSPCRSTRTDLWLVTWNCRSALRLHQDQPSTVDRATCRTCFGTAFRWWQRYFPEKRNAHSAQWEYFRVRDRFLNISAKNQKYVTTLSRTVWLLSKNCISSNLTSFLTQL